MKQRRIAADLGVGEIEPAAEVAAVRAFDLDHARAEIAEPQRGERARQELAHVEDEKAFEQRVWRQRAVLGGRSAMMRGRELRG